MYLDREIIPIDISKECTDHLVVRPISIMLSCEYAKQIREYVTLVQCIIAECKDPKYNNGESSCETLLIEAIKCTKSMVTNMLSSLTHFYHMSQKATDFRQVYVALMTLKLYTENNLHIKVENKIEEIERLTLLVDLRVQTFAVSHCVPAHQPLWLSEINKRCLRVRSLCINSELPKPYIECLSDSTTSFVSTFNSEYFADLGFKGSDLDIVHTTADLDAVWLFLNSQQPEGYSTRIRWSNDVKEITEIVDIVKYQYDTNQLAAFQKATLKAVAQLFYKEVSDTIEATFKVHGNLADEGLCPSTYLPTLTNLWPGLKKFQLAAIKEACISLRGVKTDEECKKSYLSSLERVWLNFSSINVEAITVACNAIILRNSQTEAKNTTLGSVYLNIRNYIKSNKNPKFWEDLKVIFEKVRFALPKETTETLETILGYIKNKRNVNEQQVIKLLELEMKNAIADFAEDNQVNVDPKNCLQTLNEFKGYIINNKEPILRVSLNNGLMWSPSICELPKLLINLTNSDVSDNRSNEKFCRLSFKVIKLFKMYNEFVSANFPARFSQMIVGSIKHFAENLQPLLPKLVKVVFRHMLILLKPETVNLRNALILLKVYVNDKGMSAEGKYDLWRSDEFQRLILLIINQMEIYIVQNCVINEYQKTIWPDEPKVRLQTFKTLWFHPFESFITEIDNELPILENITAIDECEVSMNNATFEKLVNNNHHENSPLNCIKKFRFKWNESFETLETIRTMVVTNFKLESLTKYQGLVQNSLMAILFGYILNIFQAANRPSGIFTTEYKQLILSKIKYVGEIVYPGSKPESLKFIINTFFWSFEGDNISQDKSKILKTKIDRELASYDIDEKGYYSTLKQYNIIRDKGIEGIAKYITPLEEFADEWIMFVKKDMNCVKNCMMVTL
ncbi:uncharacterized protein LOC126840791 [Adelges cooleyi]|uniref:uncharacterized protein LOC126840791 n=1 Tax=Adelges cooleyi TaxID=133065 RepID=UPI00217F91B6|nr:uncharacterized protein LOC126840791 [Adelges cooleyi]